MITKTVFKVLLCVVACAVGGSISTLCASETPLDEPVATSDLRLPGPQPLSAVLATVGRQHQITMVCPAGPEKTVVVPTNAGTVRALLSDIAKQADYWIESRGPAFVVLESARSFIFTADSALLDKNAWRRLTDAATRSVPADAKVRADSFTGLITARLTPSQHDALLRALGPFNPTEEPNPVTRPF